MSLKKCFLLLLGLLPISFLSAQFSAKFSAGEGYAGGDLTKNPNWKGSPESFLVDVSDGGRMTIDPGQPFRVIRYTGEGGEFTQKSLKVTLVFKLKFEVAKSADLGEGALPLGFIQIEIFRMQMRLQGPRFAKPPVPGLAPSISSSSTH